VGPAKGAFGNDDFFLHDAAASRLAWERTLDFLREHLQPAGGV
jgi:dienelactone hydrolase